MGEASLGSVLWSRQGAGIGGRVVVQVRGWDQRSEEVVSEASSLL